MRRLNYAALRHEVLAQAGAVRIRAGLDTRKDQPHDDAQWDAQLRLDRDRLERLIASGAWRFDGPRHLIIR